MRTLTAVPSSSFSISTRTLRGSPRNSFGSAVISTGEYTQRDGFTRMRGP